MMRSNCVAIKKKFVILNGAKRNEGSPSKS